MAAAIGRRHDRLVPRGSARARSVLRSPARDSAAGRGSLPGKCGLVASLRAALPAPGQFRSLHAFGVWHATSAGAARGRGTRSSRRSSNSRSSSTSAFSTIAPAHVCAAGAGRAALEASEDSEQRDATSIHPDCRPRSGRWRGPASTVQTLAQTVTPTPDQLELFRSLPRISNRPSCGNSAAFWGAGRGCRILGSLGSASGGQRQSPSTDTPTDQTRSIVRRTSARAASRSKPAIPVLKPEDSLIIEIDFQLRREAHALRAMSASSAYGAAAAPAAAGPGQWSDRAGASGQAAAQPQASTPANELSDEERARLGQADQADPLEKPLPALARRRAEPAGLRGHPTGRSDRGSGDAAAEGRAGFAAGSISASRACR